MNWSRAFHAFSCDDAIGTGARGSNHRLGLDDAILFKDNHIAIAGGIRPAIERARTTLPQA